MTKKTIDLDHSLFAIALAVVRCNWKPCIAAAVLLLAASIGQNYVDEPLPFTALRALILMLVGYSAYRVLLSGGRIAGWRAVATDDGRIPWRYSGVMLVILSPILLLGIVMTAPGSHGPMVGIEGVVFALILVLMYTVAYVLLGTALPEVAERGEAALGDAMGRGRSNYRRIAMAMMLGPWVFRACTLLLLIVAGISGLTVDLFHSDTGSLQPAALMPMLLFTGGHVFAEVLTAIVLVRAYRQYPSVARLSAAT